MRRHPFSKQFLPAAITTSLILPTSAVWANEDVLSEEIILYHPFTSGEISEQMPAPLAVKSTTAGSIEVSVFNPATRLAPESAFTAPLDIIIKDMSDTKIIPAGAKTGPDGKYKTPESVAIPTGTYYVTVGTAAPGSTAVTSQVSVTRATTTDAAPARPAPVKLSVVYPTNENVFYSVNGKQTVKHGAIAGTIYDQSDNPVSDTSVIAYNSTTRWETRTDSNGKFRIYLPPGRYHLITVGKESAPENNEYQNSILKNISVISGQTTLPFKDIKSQEPWGAPADHTLGLQVYTDSANLTATGRTIKGAAKSGTIIKIYQQIIENDQTTYKLLGTGKTGTTGKFAISLPSIQAGNILKVIATDEKENSYSAPLITVPNLSASDFNLKADTTNHTVENPIDVTFNSTLTGKINDVSGTNTSGEELSLTKDVDYTISSGVIRFKAGTFGTTPGEASVRIKAASYATADVIQIIKPGAVAANSSVAISPSNDKLTLGNRNTITITAKDKYGNVVPDQRLYLNLTITNNTSIKDERYIINNVAYTKSQTRIPLSNLTDENGQITMTIDMPAVIDGNDGMILDITNLSGSLIKQLTCMQAQSKPVSLQDIQIYNNSGTADSIEVSGLTTADTINVYDATSKTLLASLAADNITITIPVTLKAEGGTVYISKTTAGKAESIRQSVDYQEEPITP